MKIKHLLLILLVIVLIYLDVQWYISKAIIPLWYAINLFLGVVLISFIIYVLKENTYFFKKISVFLDKRIL